MSLGKQSAEFAEGISSLSPASVPVIRRLAVQTTSAPVSSLSPSTNWRFQCDGRTKLSEIPARSG
jgi:hypothetical protein